MNIKGNMAKVLKPISWAYNLIQTKWNTYNNINSSSQGVPYYDGYFGPGDGPIHLKHLSCPCDVANLNDCDLLDEYYGSGSGDDGEATNHTIITGSIQRAKSRASDGPAKYKQEIAASVAIAPKSADEYDDPRQHDICTHERDAGVACFG